MIQSVQRAIDIINYLSDNPGKCIHLNELSKQVGIKPSCCSHILETLCNSLYVERVSRRDGYRLGPMAFYLSRYGEYRDDLRHTAIPVLSWLHKQIVGAVFLTVVCDGVKYVIFHIDENKILDRSDGVIIKGYMEDTATGLLHLAYMDKESLKRVEIRQKSSSIIENPDFSARFEKIRKSGYVYGPEDDDLNQSFAFPVFVNNKLVATIGVLYPNGFDSQNYRNLVIKTGKTAATELSRRLSFS